METLQARLELWCREIDRLDEWSRVNRADQSLREQGLEQLADRLTDGDFPPREAVGRLRFAYSEALYRTAISNNGWLAQLTSDHRADLIERFRRAESMRFGATSRLIWARHFDAMPRGAQGAMGIIRGEIAKKRNHKPIRWLMQNAGAVIREIKPVFLMSPISVAQFLPPGAIEFDLVVIDEASQVRPEDSLGAIARGRQLVVVGDSKQLPPTAFFDRLLSGENEDEPDSEEDVNAQSVISPTDMESILTLCEARGLPSKRLRWHYRSKHPSLIEVSNAEFYERDLVLPPAPTADRDGYGLFVERVNGAYDRGGKRTNRIEAEAIIRAVAQHAVHHREMSLGVVTFSTAQRDLLTELLERARREDPALDAFIREGKREDFFVKNLENVQGDERDVILISVGYGPRIARQPLDSMAFGPVSTDGGERRLNVLFTRARYRCVIFVSFASSDIVPERTRGGGARVLKRFLQFAETGNLDEVRPSGEDPDSPFETAVADVMRGRGYQVDHQVGSAGFRIDLAVRDPEQPGRYILAVECDGATYHSALWARERDRLRQEVLEGLGWRFHRVWSTDWFHRRSEEVKRLFEAIEMAKAKPPTAMPVRPANAYTTTDDLQNEPEETRDTGEEIVAAPVTCVRLPAYRPADFQNSHACEPHELSVEQMTCFVKQIIDAEGPIHQEEVARRVAALFGKLRTGARILNATVRGLRHLGRQDRKYTNEGGFWFTATQAEQPPLRDRSQAPLTLRRADMIPPLEIAAAIRRVLADNGAVPADDLPRAVAALFGFLRTGQEFTTAVEPIVKKLKADCEVAEGPAGLMLAA